MTKKQEAEFIRLAIKAHEAGLKTAAAAKPIPMIVSQHVNMANDNSPFEKSWYVEDGVCGFGWVVIRPATSSFARWAKKNIPLCGNHYYGGLSISSALRTQSMARNEAYCQGYAEVLSEAGINAYAQSRID